MQYLIHLKHTDKWQQTRSKEIIVYAADVAEAEATARERYPEHAIVDVRRIAERAKASTPDGVPWGATPRRSDHYRD